MKSTYSGPNSRQMMRFVVLTTIYSCAAGILAPTAHAVDDEIYWCPMRGNPCKIEDYHAPGRCNDCFMPLVTKAVYQARSKNVQENKINLGVLIYTGFELLDVFGPMEMFAYAEMLDMHLIAEKAGNVVSGQGVTVVADYGFDDAPDLDIILVPGGAGTFAELSNETLLDWLRESAAKADITTSVCTGSAILAKAGILDGHKATSNKQFFSLAKSQSDKVDWVWEARWVDDGEVITSSGVSAGMDMALHIIERLFGSETAEAIAVGTEYEWQRDPTRDIFADMVHE